MYINMYTYICTENETVISEAIWLVGIVELPPKKLGKCPLFRVNYRVARRIVMTLVDTKKQLLFVPFFVSHLSHPEFSVGKNVAMSIQVNSASHPHRSRKSAGSRTGQRMPMMELKPAPTYFKEVVFLRKGPKGNYRFSFAISESQRKKSLAQNCQVLRMTVTFSTTNHLSSTSLWRKKNRWKRCICVKKTRKNTWCATKAHDDIGSLQNCNGQNTSRIPTNIVGQWLLRSVQGRSRLTTPWFLGCYWEWHRFEFQLDHRDAEMPDFFSQILWKIYYTNVSSELNLNKHNWKWF